MDASLALDSPPLPPASPEPSPSVPRSVQLGRPYALPQWDENGLTLQQALASAHAALPTVGAAYHPSGQAPWLARLLLLLATPVVAVIGGVMILAILLIEAWLQQTIRAGARYSGLMGLLADGAAIAIIAVVVPWMISQLARVFGARSPRGPAVLSLLASLALGIVFFWPIWNGESLADTGLQLLFIPLSWIVILLGGLAAPLMSYQTALNRVSEQKFCETSGVYLRPMRQIALPFVWGEDALEALAREDYARLATLPRLRGGRNAKAHRATVRLWWHPKAATAFTEMSVHFKAKARQVAVGEMRYKEADEQWLAFSQQIDRASAERFVAAVAA